MAEKEENENCCVLFKEENIFFFNKTQGTNKRCLKKKNSLLNLSTNRVNGKRSKKRESNFRSNSSCCCVTLNKMKMTKFVLFPIFIFSIFFGCCCCRYCSKVEKMAENWAFRWLHSSRTHMWLWRILLRKKTYCDGIQRHTHKKDKDNRTFDMSIEEWTPLVECYFLLSFSVASILRSIALVRFTCFLFFLVDWKILLNNIDCVEAFLWFRFVLVSMLKGKDSIRYFWKIWWKLQWNALGPTRWPVT